MFPLAYFGIESSGLNLAIDLVIVFVVVVYFALVYWTYADAHRRIQDPIMVGLATVVSLFPFVGTVVYMILRPPEYLEDVHERELEVRAAEARVFQLEQSLCPHCDYHVQADFLRCPSCLRKLKERCVTCSRPLDQAWTICPYCEADVPGLAVPRTRRRRTSAAVLESELPELEGSLAADAEQPGAAAPVPATEAAARPPSGGRASRPGGRARPS